MNHVASFFDTTTKDDNSLIPQHRISWPLTDSLPEIFEAIFTPGIGEGDIPGYIVLLVDDRLSPPSDTCVVRRFSTGMPFASDDVISL